MKQRFIIYFKDSDTFANLEATDIFESGEYLQVYNDTKLVGMFLIDTIKVAYLSTKKENANE